MVDSNHVDNYGSAPDPQLERTGLSTGSWNCFESELDFTGSGGWSALPGCSTAIVGAPSEAWRFLRG
jgi:hypothetical protein